MLGLHATRVNAGFRVCICAQRGSARRTSAQAQSSAGGRIAASTTSRVSVGTKDSMNWYA
jgi:hypothetical protein